MQLKYLYTLNALLSMSFRPLLFFFGFRLHSRAGYACMGGMFLCELYTAQLFVIFCIQALHNLSLRRQWPGTFMSLTVILTWKIELKTVFGVEWPFLVSSSFWSRASSLGTHHLVDGTTPPINCQLRNSTDQLSLSFRISLKKFVH